MLKPCQCEIASDEVREKKWEPQYKGSRVNPLIGSVPLKMVKGLQRVSKTGQKWPLGHFRWYWACQWTDTLVYMAAHSIVILSSKFVREGQAILSWQDLNFQHEDQTSTVTWSLARGNHMCLPGAWALIIADRANLPEKSETLFFLELLKMLVLKNSGPLWGFSWNIAISGP